MTLPVAKIPGLSEPITRTVRVTCDTTMPRIDLAQAMSHMRAVDAWIDTADLAVDARVELQSLTRRARRAIIVVHAQLEVSA